MLRLLTLCLALSSSSIGAQAVAHEHSSSEGAAPHDAADASFDLVIRKIQPGVWVQTSHHTFPNGARYPANGLIVRQGSGLLLVDSAWGEAATAGLLDEIRQRIGLPVRKAIITHFHSDRISGTHVLEEAGVEVQATPLTKKLSASIDGPVPKGTLRGLKSPGSSVSIGSVEVFYPGPAHTVDNLMVWLPKRHLLYGGCAVRAMSWSSLGNLKDADVASWPEAIRGEQARYPNVEIVVPGHGSIGGPELLRHTLRLLANQD